MTLLSKGAPNSLRNTSTPWQWKKGAGTRLRTDYSGLSCSPSVLGGMMETKARDALKLWKSIMTGGVYSLLFRRFSIGLLRVRARCFEP
jgi:hypothetical protein